MRIEVWPEHGPINSKPIFEAFIQSLRDNGDEVFVNTRANADVAIHQIIPKGHGRWLRLPQSLRDRSHTSSAQLFATATLPSAPADCHQRHGEE